MTETKPQGTRGQCTQPIKNMYMVLVTLFCVILGFSLYTKTLAPNKDITDKPNKEKETTTEKQTERLSVGNRDEITGECKDFYQVTGGELSLYNLPQKIKEDTTATKVLEQDCQMALQTGVFDVTSDNKDDILMITEAIDCVTCRATSLIIISEGKVISDRQVTNAVIRKAPGRTDAFELKEPIALKYEGACCPTKGTVSVYEYAPDTDEKFALVDQYTEDYKNKDNPILSERGNIEQ